MKDHFCYLGGLHASQEPKLILKGQKAPWYKTLTPAGWFFIIGFFGSITGLSTGLYSCRHQIASYVEASKPEKVEYPIGHAVEVIPEKAPQKKK